MKNLGNAKTYGHNLLEETTIVDRHQCHLPAKFSVFADEGRDKLPTIHWLPTCKL